MNILNLNNKADTIVLTLYKNVREQLMNIPIECISSDIANYLTMENVSSFTLKIYNKLEYDGKLIDNRLYKVIKSKQQIISQIVFKDKNIRYRRWTIGKIKKYENDKYSYKEIEVKEFQDTLKGKRVNFNQDKVLQLYNKESLEDDDGILDNLKQQTGWSINYLDEDCRYEKVKTMDSTDLILQQNYSKNNITQDCLFYENNVNINIQNNEPIYFQFKYENIKVTNSEGREKANFEEILNTFGKEPIDKPIKKIQAYHYSVVGYKYGVRYVFTLSDGTTTERYDTLCNCLEGNLSFDKLTFIYETGKLIEKTRKKYINIDSDVNTSWYEYLNSIQDDFNCVFMFDSYNMRINCISRDNLGKQAPYYINFNSSLINYTTDAEDSNFPNGLKVNSSNDGITIVEDNYFGTDTIYDFSYYIQSGTMSDELIRKWRIYEEVLIDKQEEWNILKENLTVAQQKKLRIDTQIETLKSQINVLDKLFNNYQQQGMNSEISRIKSEKNELQNRLNTSLGLSNQYNTLILNINSKITQLNSDIKFENIKRNGVNIFDKDDIFELNMLIFIEEYNDDYFTDNYSLYNYSIDYLKNKLQPNVKLSVEVQNMTKLLHQDWKKILVLGDKFKFTDLNEEDIRELGTSNFIFSSYTMSIKGDRNIQVKNLNFVNKIQNSNDVKKNKIVTLRKTVMRTNKTISNYDNVSLNANYSHNYISNMRNEGLDLSDVKLISKTDTNINVINDNGFMITNSQNENESMYLTGGCIFTTNDGWESSTRTLDGNGICAEMIKGCLQLGKDLYMSQVDKNNEETKQFYIGNFNENHNIDKDGNSFGIQFNNKNNEKIFIGLEYNEKLDIQEPLFVIKDNNGNKCFDTSGDVLYFRGKVENYINNHLAIQIDNEIKLYNFNNDTQLGGIGHFYNENGSYVGIFGENNPMVFTVKNNEGKYITYLKIGEDKSYIKNIDTNQINIDNNIIGYDENGNLIIGCSKGKNIILGDKNDDKISPLIEIGDDISINKSIILFNNFQRKIKVLDKEISLKNIESLNSMVELHGESKTDKNGDCIIELPFDFKNVRDVTKEYYFSYDIYNSDDENETLPYHLKIIDKDNNKIALQGSKLIHFHYSIIAYQKENVNSYEKKNIEIENGNDIIVNKLKSI